MCINNIDRFANVTKNTHYVQIKSAVNLYVNIGIIKIINFNPITLKYIIKFRKININFHIFSKLLVVSFSYY